MAVQQNKKSPSKRGMHRAHDFLVAPPLAVEPTTGEAHLRHVQASMAVAGLAASGLPQVQVPRLAAG